VSRNAAVLSLALLLCVSVSVARSLNSEPKLDDVAIHHGESASFSDDPLTLTLTFSEVRSDSRCPVGVKCVRAGEAVVVLLAKANDTELSPTESELVFEVPPGGEAEGDFADWTIRVLRLEPEARVDRKIEDSDYIVTVRVEGRTIDRSDS
jgi:hypothetical protein